MAGYSRTSSRSGRATAAWLTGLAALTALALGGCSPRDRHYVTGTVRFPDGLPLTVGRLVVSYGPKSMIQGNAYIQPDGSFRVGEVKDGDGMRGGTVKVGVIGLELISGISGGVKEVYHCDPKYFDPETSGLVFEVPKQLRWEIVVEKPSKEGRRRMAQEQQAEEMPEPLASPGR
jgi:hypothetical protein